MKSPLESRPQLNQISVSPKNVNLQLVTSQLFVYI